jgi:DNA-binding transcriptional LysR family regulator
MPSDLAKSLYMSEPFVLCTPRAPASRSRAPSIGRLAREPLVIFARGVSPDYYERVMSLCAQLGLEPQVRHEVRHWLSVVALVSRGTGYSLVPGSMSDSGISGVHFSPIPDTGIRSEVFMVWNARKMPSILPEMIASLQARGG